MTAAHWAVKSAAGIRGDLSEIKRVPKFFGHSLRAGWPSSAEVNESYIQKQLAQTPAEMTPATLAAARPFSCESNQGNQGL